MKSAKAGCFRSCALAALAGLAGAGGAFAFDQTEVIAPSPVTPSAVAIATSAPSNSAGERASKLAPSSLELAIQGVAVQGPDYTEPGYGPTVPEGMPSVYAPSQEQNAPGAYGYDSPSEAWRTYIPSYFYNQNYYDRPGVGARAIADYAPPGYEARDQQDSPAVPEFSRIPAPIRVSQEERDRFVARGMYPGSFLAPGTNTSFRFRGFVRLAALYDFDPIGSTDSFVTNTIPVPQTVGQNFNM